MLADGYHRLATARLRAVVVDAEIRRASRREALEYAAALGAAQRGVTPAQAEDAIKRRSRSR